MTTNRHPITYRSAALVEHTMQLLEAATRDTTRSELRDHLTNTHGHRGSTIDGLINDLAHLGAIRITGDFGAIRITELGRSWLNNHTPAIPSPNGGTWNTTPTWLKMDHHH